MTHKGGHIIKPQHNQMLPFIIEISVVNANSIDSDEMLQSAVSDLGLHCLPMLLLWLGINGLK